MTNPPLKRLWSKVQVNGLDECWEWTASKNDFGRGRIRVEGKLKLASRVIYSLTRGIIIGNWCICHTCDNPGCCNPTHLWKGSQSQNSQDAVKKGRHARTSLQGTRHGGAKLSESMVISIRKDERSNAELSRIYSVSRACIILIKKNKTWRHLS